MVALVIVTSLGGSVSASGACSGPKPFAYTVFGSAESYANSGKYSLDEEGILTFDYGEAYGNLGRWHNPFFIARYGHALYRDWHDGGCGDASLREKFLLQANWLADNHEDVNGMALWTYPFANTYFDVPAGWISGIGQSQIAGVLYRAHIVTGEERFRALGRKAVEPYFRPVDDGGVTAQGDGGMWIQEVPNANGTAFNILNGHITGIAGLADVASIAEEEGLDHVVSQGIDAVRNTARKFDAGFASFYSLGAKEGEDHRLAPRHNYNLLHVSQMLMLYEIDGDPLFLEMAMRFQKYETLEDERFAKRSTNPETHGPGEAAGFYGVRFWSDNAFPTWYEVRMAETAQLDGIYLGSYIEKAAPREFSVSVLNAGLWREVWSSTDNTEQNLYLAFDEPVRTAGIRLDIKSDNGNNNVAMNSIMPIRSDAGLGAVANYCNHRGSEVDGVMSFNVEKALDDDPHTNMTAHCEGFVILPPSIARQLVVRSVGDPGEAIKASASADLQEWTLLGDVHAGDSGLVVPKGEYLRLDFDSAIRSLNDVDLIEAEGSPTVLPISPAPFEPGFRDD